MTFTLLPSDLQSNSFVKTNLRQKATEEQSDTQPGNTDSTKIAYRAFTIY